MKRIAFVFLAVWTVGCGSPEPSEAPKGAAPTEAKAAVNSAYPLMLPTDTAAPTSTTAQAASPAAGGGAFKVALLNPGSINDAGWNASAFEGLKRIGKELGAETLQKESLNPSERKKDLRDYAKDGCRLVFGHGFEFSSPIAEVAPGFPETVFISSGGDKTGPNFCYMDFRLEEASYLLGIIAGTMTKSGIIGIVGGAEIPPVQRSNAALMAGAKKANPKVQFKVAWVGNWEDAGKAKEQALAQIREGADLLYQNADKAGMGVFQAARASRGVFAFGSNSNQNDVEPELILASAVTSIPEGFVHIAREVKEGRFQSRAIGFGIKDNVVSLEVNPGLKDKIPASALEMVESEKARILSGELDVNQLGVAK